MQSCVTTVINELEGFGEAWEDNHEKHAGEVNRQGSIFALWDDRYPGTGYLLRYCCGEDRPDVITVEARFGHYVCIHDYISAVYSQLVRTRNQKRRTLSSMGKFVPAADARLIAGSGMADFLQVLGER